MADERIRTGVIGSGFMGQLHCKAYSSSELSDFVGLFDADKIRADEAAAKFGGKAFASMEELLDNVDAVSIAAPTVLHHKIALECIKAGKNILIEKPIAATLKEAVDVVSAVKNAGITAAVGYIERFNPTVIELLKLVKGRKISSIEAQRLAPPANRANDVSVVFDLMIHDLDIVIALAGADTGEIRASGKKHGSDVLNDVEAGISFPNGIAATVISNKVADRKLRLVTVKGDGFSFTADLIAREIVIEEKGSTKKVTCTGGEPIKEEVEDFLRAVKQRSKPNVSAADSINSFKMACDIEAFILGE